MKLTEYILLPRSERSKHVDLSTPCDTKGSWSGRGLRKKVLRLLGVENDVPNWCTASIALAHQCENHSICETPCYNPLHVVVSTYVENRADTPAEVRSQAAVKRESKRSPEYRRQKAREAGVASANARSPELRKEIAGEAGKKGASMKWISLHTGLIANAGTVSRHHKSLGHSDDRVLLSDEDASMLIKLGVSVDRRKVKK